MRAPLDRGYTFNVPALLKLVKVGAGAALVVEEEEMLEVKLAEEEEGVATADEQLGLTVPVTVVLNTEV